MPTTLLGNKEVGSVVKVNVNGASREFLVVHQGLPSSMYDESCNGTWLLMKDIYETRQWHSSNVNDYANSAIHSYLNNTWINKLDANIKAAIKQVKLPYVNGTANSAVASGANGLSCKVFLLSGYEVGFTTSDNSYFPADGAKLSYFENGTGQSALNKRIANYNGSATYWWLRSPNALYATYAWSVDSDGGYSYSSCANTYGVRPALILPSSLLVSDDGTVIGNLPPTAPTTLTVPTVSAGEACAISWTAASDADGAIAAYHLERSVNGNPWEEIYSGTALTYTDTIGTSWGTVAYRVCAEDDMGATGPYTTSETQEVQAGVLYISGPADDLGELASQYAFQLTVNVSGPAEVTDISLALELDGLPIYSGLVDKGERVTVPIDPRILQGGSHSIHAAARKTDYVTAAADYSFSTPVFPLPDGGLGVQLQDNQGRALFPQTTAAMVSGLPDILPRTGGAMTGTFTDSNAAQVRNIRLTDTDLADQVGQETDEPNGTVILVYEVEE